MPRWNPWHKGAKRPSSSRYQDLETPRRCSNYACGAYEIQEGDRYCPRCGAEQLIPPIDHEVTQKTKKSSYMLQKLKTLAKFKKPRIPGIRNEYAEVYIPVGGSDTQGNPYASAGIGSSVFHPDDLARPGATTSLPGDRTFSQSTTLSSSHQTIDIEDGADIKRRLCEGCKKVVPKQSCCPDCTEVVQCRKCGIPKLRGFSCVSTRCLKNSANDSEYGDCSDCGTPFELDGVCRKCSTDKASDLKVITCLNCDTPMQLSGICRTKDCRIWHNSGSERTGLSFDFNKQIWRCDSCKKPAPILGSRCRNKDCPAPLYFEGKNRLWRCIACTKPIYEGSICQNRSCPRRRAHVQKVDAQPLDDPFKDKHFSRSEDHLSSVIPTGTNQDQVIGPSRPVTKRRDSFRDETQQELDRLHVSEWRRQTYATLTGESQSPPRENIQTSKKIPPLVPPQRRWAWAPARTPHPKPHTVGQNASGEYAGTGEEDVGEMVRSMRTQKEEDKDKKKKVLVSRFSGWSSSDTCL